MNKPLGKLTIESEQASFERNMSALDFETCAPRITFEMKVLFKTPAQLNEIIKMADAAVWEINEAAGFVLLQIQGLRIYFLVHYLADKFNKDTPEGRDSRYHLLHEVPYEIDWNSPNL